MLRKFTRLFSSTAVNLPIKDFNISLETRSKLRALGVTELFPIQHACLKPILDGKDVVAKAKTGTGKTFAFAVPVIEQLQSEEELDKLQKVGRGPRVLTLAPTRELANQTATVFSKLVSYGGLKILPIYGGVSYDNQKQALKRGVDVVVGAPGRVKDLMERGDLSLMDVDYVILDEVDRMLDMGFINDVDDIIKGVYANPIERPQTMLFSATMPNWVTQVSKNYLNRENTEFVSIEDDSMTPDTVRHIAMPVPTGNEAFMLSVCLEQYLTTPTSRAIVFCDRKKETEQHCAKPYFTHKRSALHGDMSQAYRDTVLRQFRHGTIQVLFTTDVAARGLDIPDVELVVLMSPPLHHDSYVHRSGRTGRAGNTGNCILLYRPYERHLLKRLEKIVGIQFETLSTPTKVAFRSIAKKKMESIKRIPDDLCEDFSDMAKELVREMGAEAAISRVLAFLCGRTGNGNEKDFSRSLLTGRRGWKTMMLKVYVPHKVFKSTLFQVLERSGLQLADRISQVQFTEDRSAIVFDIEAEAVEELLEKFPNGQRYSITPLDEDCPPLESSVRHEKNYKGGFQHHNSFRNGDSDFDRPPLKRFRDD